MQLNISGRHLDVTESLKNYVDEKFTRLSRHFDPVADVHVILEVDKLIHKAEATVKVNGATLFAEASEPDMYAAIDALIDKLDRQVIKYKEKATERSR